MVDLRCYESRLTVGFVTLELLFYRTNVFDLLEHRRRALKAEVENLSAADLSSAPRQEIVHRLATNFKLEATVLEDDRAHISHREVNVDVSQDPMRLILDRSRPFYVRGTEITFCIPFRGDPNSFQIRPTTFNTNPPRGRISNGEVLLTYVRTDNDAVAAKNEYDQTLRNIKQYLDWFRVSVEDFNSKIGSQVEALLNQRVHQLSATADMIAAIGLPERAVQTNRERFNHSEKPLLQKSISSVKKWDVFISYASEDKNEIARPLAEALRSGGISVWYDEFALKIGDSLRASIDFGLANSRFGVVILSKHFFEKHWPVQELNGLITRERKSKTIILPVWHKVDSDEVQAFSPILADRIAAKSEHGLGKLVDQIAAALDQD